MSDDKLPAEEANAIARDVDRALIERFRQAEAVIPLAA
jgi:hypothetical protein